MKNSPMRMTCTGLGLGLALLIGAALTYLFTHNQPGEALSWLIYLNSRIDWMRMLGIVAIIFMIWAIWKAQHSQDVPFDIAEAFQGDNNKTSMGKLLAFIGGITTTWIVVDAAVSRNITDWMFLSYLGVLVAGKVATEFVQSKSTGG